jgi:two-component system response regulator CpxR
MEAELQKRNRGNAASLQLVDEDVDLCALKNEYFAFKGLQITCVYNGRDGLAHALGSSCDLVILDGMLLILDGFEVLHQLRQRYNIPVVMLKARAGARPHRRAGVRRRWLHP